MPLKPIVLDLDIQSLQDEGLRVEVMQGHLLVHEVPYITAQRRVARGVMVTNLSGIVGKLGKPSDHQVWFVGEFPCHTDGRPIESIRHNDACIELWPGFFAQHRFSNKPVGQADFPKTYSDKIRHYLALISSEARAIDPEATPYVFDPVVSFESDSVFHYWDSASTRAGILSITEKLKLSRVAIIGLGGTGSYILDQVAKTPVREIHLFDGDRFEQHSAFRAPGAASLADIEAKLPKVEYYAARYGQMHKGIRPHVVFLDEDNLSELDGFDFVFLCVDKGGVRKLLSDSLRAKGTPFVDTGMELNILPEANALIGTCRATLCTPEKGDHFERHAPLGTAAGNDLYRSNIQVADMNMLNAALAVGLWKQYRDFYLSQWKPHHTTYSVDAHSLTRSEMLRPPPDEDQDHHL